MANAVMEWPDGKLTPSKPVPRTTISGPTEVKDRSRSTSFHDSPLEEELQGQDQHEGDQVVPAAPERHDDEADSDRGEQETGLLEHPHDGLELVGPTVEELENRDLPVGHLVVCDRDE